MNNMAATLNGYSDTADGLGAAIDALNSLHSVSKLSDLTRKIVAISGAFDAEQDLPRLQGVLEQLPKAEFAQAAPNFAGPAQVGSHQASLAREQAVVFEAYSAPGALGEDCIIGDILADLCCDMAGKLFLEVREKRGLAYFVGANRLVSRHNSMFYFYAGTHPDSDSAVFEQIAAEVERIRNGKLSDEELRRSKAHLKTQRRIQLQNTSACTMEVCIDALYGLPVNRWVSYGERLAKVTLADVQAFAQAYFKPEHRVRLTVKGD